jgi:hypothetical protein
MAVRIEDAGWEIRDLLVWIYGSGFPKSLDVSKAIDQQRTEDREPVREICRLIRSAMDAKGFKSRDLVALFGNCHPRLIDHWAARDTDSQPTLPTWEQWLTLRQVLGIDATHDDAVWTLNGRKGKPGDVWTNAAVIGEHTGTTPGLVGHRFATRDTTIREASEIARRWDGWGTALKPALEPITMARRPLAGTVAGNVLEHGTGAINIDATRVGERWPANVLHDGETLPDDVARFFYCAKPSRAEREAGLDGLELRSPGEVTGGRAEGSAGLDNPRAGAGRTSGARNDHPTVKPLALMRYLVRLITPQGGTVLDPFAGSGTTLLAAKREGFRAIGIEQDKHFCDIAARRIAHLAQEPQQGELI